jgi:hypothetical protein
MKDITEMMNRLAREAMGAERHEAKPSPTKDVPGMVLRLGQERAGVPDDILRSVAAAGLAVRLADSSTVLSNDPPPPGDPPAADPARAVPPTHQLVENMIKTVRMHMRVHPSGAPRFDDPKPASVTKSHNYIKSVTGRQYAGVEVLESVRRNLAAP